MKPLSLALKILIVQMAYSVSILVSQASLCYANCLGDSLQPYHNILAAIQAVPSFLGSNHEILLLKEESPKFMMSETLIANGSLLNLTTALLVSSNLTIRPLLCSDPEAAALKPA
jgi:hypothetical protein